MNVNVDERQTLVQPDWSRRMADSVIRRGAPFKWHYEHGLMLQAMERVWERTGDEKYLNWIQNSIAPFVDANGEIETYRLEEFNLDQVKPGGSLFLLHRLTNEPRYREALGLLREQLRRHPRTREGGFWHKQIYPYQMWLDGIYMAGPFYARYGREFHEPEAFDDVARQILLIARRTRDPRTGLFYHAWDESRRQRWADPVSGCSPHFWGRAMGWFSMALVDVLDEMPANHAARSSLVDILNGAIDALARIQDPQSGLWYQVLDQGSRAGNYLEASASCMFVYAIVRGIRQGYVLPAALEVARRAYRGILGTLIEIDEGGLVNLHGICGVAGLGGSPYRDGSYEYYVGEKTVMNDYKGVGPFILASLEMEKLA